MATYYYRTEIFHKGLNKYRVVKGTTRYEANQKAEAIMAQWDAQWERQLKREEKIRNAEEGLEYAEEQTTEAEEVQEALDSILQSSLSPEEYNIEKLKVFDEFQKPVPSKPLMEEIPDRPVETDPLYNQQLSFIARMSKKKVEENEKNNKARFDAADKAWVNTSNRVIEENRKKQTRYEADLAAWNQERERFEKDRAAHNHDVDVFEELLEQKDVSSVERYVTLTLEDIEYPFDFSLSVDAEYIPDTNSLIIDAMLPVIDDLPSLKSVTYVKSRNDFKKSMFSESVMKKKYENVIYQIVLQIMNYSFFASKCKYIDAVTVNGKVKTLDKASGKQIEPYILSVQVTRENFEDINLSAVDPKAWFKSAKGISAASIATVTPVAPIVKMSREDHRFIEGYSVVDNVDESVNLAAMDWKDFENLIREIFEQEFNVDGGEVKITQASRDGGVDAVAFDPDPIRGGKIVIQAKRYTNVVGVSAVRDLYGTVMNEGANKGILVTTSNFGNDAYQFAQGKPLSLIDGANLLYLLEKHGRKAKIDIPEAKKMLGLKNKHCNY